MKSVLLISLLALVACTEQKPYVIHTPHIIKPSEALYKCPKVALPNPDTLTDKQVAEVIIRYDGANKTCRNSLYAIRKFIKESERKILE